MEYAIDPQPGRPLADAPAAPEGAGPNPADLRALFAGTGFAPDGVSARDRGDKDLNPTLPVDPDLKSAAVLVPLVARADGITVLLTQRTDQLSTHAGQIAFPGGQVEGHEDALAAALRETEEEVGLDRSHIEPLGSLDRYVTRTGFMIAPIVGLVHPPFTLTLQPSEVADAFEVPLAFILNPANRGIQVREFYGIERKFYVYPFENRMIWGATAGILTNLVEILSRRS